MIRRRLEEKEEGLGLGQASKRRQARKGNAKISQVLRQQMVEGNSKLAFLFGASNILATEHMERFVDMAEDASKIF